jgi:hypothetical protein
VLEIWFKTKLITYIPWSIAAVGIYKATPLGENCYSWKTENGAVVKDTQKPKLNLLLGLGITPLWTMGC